MSDVQTWKVEAEHPGGWCNAILEVRASTRELAIKRFLREAKDMRTGFGSPDASWPIVSAEVVEAWTYPEGQEPGDTLTSADDETEEP